jgi:hypothetical protein
LTPAGFAPARGDAPPQAPSALNLLDASVALAHESARAGFHGSDPYDGLSWGWPPVLVAGRRRRQALIQLHARSPVDLRRLYRQRPPVIAKTLAVFGSVGVRAHRLGAGEPARAMALSALEQLDADRRAGPRAWGYPWDTQTRWSFYRAGTPNVVATTFAASSLLEGAAQFGRADFAERARDAARWVLEELWVEPAGYFAYHPARPGNVHNANLLGAWLVHVALGDDPGARDQVRRAVERTLAAQRPDGSFPYGEARGLEWVDSFHSGYVLTCLARVMGDPRIDEALARGARHYAGFFDGAGRARLWADRPYPEDGHSAGTGLTTLAVLARRGLVEQELVERVASRLLTAGIRHGHVVHRRHRRWRTTVRYPRWCDAHAALGLVDAAAGLQGAGDLAPGS